MERNLQIILMVGTLGLILFIVNKVRKGTLELRYSLLWLFASGVLFLLACFPSIVDTLSELFHIQESVNTIFLLAIFFMLLIIFSLTSTLSKKTGSINTLTQEVALLKLEVKNLLLKQMESDEDERSARSKLIDVADATNCMKGW